MSSRNKRKKYFKTSNNNTGVIQFFVQMFYNTCVSFKKSIENNEEKKSTYCIGILLHVC